MLVDNFLEGFLLPASSSTRGSLSLAVSDDDPKEDAVVIDFDAEDDDDD